MFHTIIQFILVMNLCIACKSYDGGMVVRTYNLAFCAAPDMASWYHSSQGAVIAFTWDSFCAFCVSTVLCSCVLAWVRNMSLGWIHFSCISFLTWRHDLVLNHRLLIICNCRLHAQTVSWQVLFSQYMLVCLPTSAALQSSCLVFVWVLPSSMAVSGVLLLDPYLRLWILY